MKTIVITGPSGSGKTYLSKKLSKLFVNSIVINTDSYYRDNIFIRFLAIFIDDIYDRPFSIKKNEIKKTLRSIHNKEKLISFNKYDFKRKLSSHSKIRIQNYEEKQFVIFEGIFSHRLDLRYQESINIICEDRKEICFKRRLKRDQLERGRNIMDINKRFSSSWYLFHKNINNYINKYNVISLNPVNEINYEKLVLNLITLSKKK